MASRLAFISVITLFIAACSNNPLEVTISRCPAVAVVGDVGTITRFVGDSRDQEDMVFTVTLAHVESECEEGSDVISNIKFDILARTGPAYEAGDLEVTYFTAVMKDNSQLITKRTYDTRISFDGNGTGRAPQVIEVYVPTIEQARTYNYEVLIGFDALPDDIYFNLTR